MSSPHKVMVTHPNVTLLEYIRKGRHKAGQCLTLKKVDGNTQQMWVGHATVFHMPSTTDAEIGWDYKSPFMQSIVTMVVHYT